MEKRAMRVSGLRNDRDAIIAIVAEHIMADDKKLHRAKIFGMIDKPPGIEIIEHNSNWVFAYDEKNNNIYINEID